MRQAIFLITAASNVFASIAFRRKEALATGPRRVAQFGPLARLWQVEAISPGRQALITCSWRAAPLAQGFSKNAALPTEAKLAWCTLIWPEAEQCDTCMFMERYAYRGEVDAGKRPCGASS